MRFSVCVVAVAIVVTSAARVQAEPIISYAEAIARARRVAPDLAIARGREAVARAEVGIAGTYSNPSLITGTSTQAARFSVAASVPLVIFGQRGAAVRASEADFATVRVDTEVTWNDVRAGTARAYVALWRAQQIAVARADAATLTQRLEAVVAEKVALGATPEIDSLRARSERLRADVDAQEAEQLVGASSSELARWIAGPPGGVLRASGEADVPATAPPLGEFAARAERNPAVRRESADARAAEARADRELALVRPGLVLDLGADFGDPSLPATNYRAQLAIDVPIFNQRGAYVERERATAATARSRADAAKRRATAEMEIAHRTFVAASARSKALAAGVVPAAEAAARAIEDSYTLGRAQLVAVIDATKSRLDAKVMLVEAIAARANAWIDIEHAVGQP